MDLVSNGDMGAGSRRAVDESLADKGEEPDEVSDCGGLYRLRS